MVGTRIAERPSLHRRRRARRAGRRGLQARPGQGTRPLQGRRTRPRHLPAPIPGALDPGRAGHLRHRRYRHRRGPHRARPRRRRLLYRPALRARPHLPASMRAATSMSIPPPGPMPAAGLRRPEGVEGESGHRRHARRARRAAGRRAISSTPIRTAGAATIPSSFAPPSSGLSRSKRR